MTSENEIIGSTISHFRILEKLGEGGMGVVYKAEDTKLKRLLALKFLPPHLSASEQDKARFIQEAQAASSLNHPNVCTIHDIQEENGRMFIVIWNSPAAMVLILFVMRSVSTITSCEVATASCAP